MDNDKLNYNVDGSNYNNRQYRAWLLEKVIVECWTTNRCANYLNRDAKLVEADLDKFLKGKSTKVA
jgi:hypothetical protein